MRLEGDKVALREKRLSDAENDYAWSTDDELSRLDAARPLTMSFQQALALYQEELAFPPSRRQRFGVETFGGEHIGNCMLYGIDEARGEAELGIMIGDRRFWSKAYGTDAVKTLLRYTFTQTPLKRVYLHTLDWNIRAQKSFQKCGFLPTGRVERGGFTFVAMEIRREQWEQTSRPQLSAVDSPGG